MTVNKLNWLIYKTAMIHTERQKFPIPDDEFWTTPAPGFELAIRVPMIAKVVFILPGVYSLPPDLQYQAKTDRSQGCSRNVVSHNYTFLTPTQQRNCSTH